MPFREVSRMDEKLEFVMLASAEGANVRSLCRRFGISPTTGYKWLARWHLDGMAGLGGSRRPQSPSRSIAAMEQARCCRCARASGVGRPQDRPAAEGSGPRSGSGALDGDGDPEAARDRTGRVWRRSGLNRFERARPNELWQMDFKGHVALPAGRLHPLTVLDDHSRFAVVLAACGDERTETVNQQLVLASAATACPRR